MTPAGHAPFENPYTPYPGGGGPPHDTTPEEGTGELWTFFWVALLCTFIIAGAGVTTWFLVAAH